MAPKLLKSGPADLNSRRFGSVARVQSRSAGSGRARPRAHRAGDEIERFERIALRCEKTAGN